MKILNKIFGGFISNPIIKREIKQTFRKPKVFWTMTIYLFLLAAAASYIFSTTTYVINAYDPKTSTIMYFFILGTQLFLMTFIAPISTSASISGERERQTLDLLIITKTGMYDIILGKLLSSLLIIGILIILSMPVYAVVFYYGGVSIVQFLLNQLYILSYVSVIGALGISFSAKVKKSTSASVLTLLSIFGLTIGSWIIMGICAISMTSSAGVVVRQVIGTFFITNPIVSFISMVDSQTGSNAAWSMIDFMGFDFNNTVIYCWHINIVVYFIVTHLLIKSAAKRIAPLRKK